MLDVVIAEWLGIEYTKEVSSESDIIFEWADAELRVTNDFLLRPFEAEPSAENIPLLPLERWLLPEVLATNIEDGVLPIIFGKPEFIKSGKKASISLDIFGSIFFVLSRYEEVALKSSDQHDRFPAAEGIAYKDGHLERPIVDEYVEILWNALKSIMPEIKRRIVKGQVLVSCDVDEPYDRGLKNTRALVKSITKMIILRRSINGAARSILNVWFSSCGNYKYDPYWCFDWYMDVCEKFGLKANFFFIPTSGVNDEEAVYKLKEPRIKQLMRSIIDRGHGIGMHASYYSYLNESLIIQERNSLAYHLQEISQQARLLESRQHFLRWRVEQTPDILANAGFFTDSTGGFADAVGFRFGTSRRFTMWSWKRREALTIKQQPLIAMEVTFQRYMKLGLGDESISVIRKLCRSCIRYGGIFSILWHNSSLDNKSLRENFEKTLMSVVEIE